MKYRNKGFYFLQCFFFLKDFKTCQSSGTAERICGIGMTVIKGFELFVIIVKGVIDFVGCQGGGKRQRPRSYSLCQTDKIGLHRSVLACKHFTCSAKASGYLIED